MAPQSLLSTLPVDVFETIFQHAFDGIAISENGRMLYVNPGLAAMFGLTVEEMTGKLTYDLARPGESFEAVKDSSLSNDVRYYIASGVRKDGKEIRSEVRSYPYAWNGRALRLTALRDITGAVEADARLRESERRFRTFIEVAEEGIIQVDGNSVIVFVNPRMARLLGYEPEEMVGRDVFGFMPEKVQPQVRQRITARKQGLREQYDLVYNHKNGGEVWTINSATPLFGPDGSYQGALGFHTDITERRRSEEALRETNELFEATFEQAAVGIAHTSPENQWLRFNRRLCEIFGTSAEQLRSRGYREFLCPEYWESNASGYRRLLSGELQHFLSEERYRRDDGRLIWLRLTASLVRGDQGQPKYFVTICQDITAEKEAEDKLAELRSQMLFSSKASALGEIANGIAHEINNPLSVIRAYTDVLRQAMESGRVAKAAEAPAEKQRFLSHVDKIDATVSRITQIVRSLVVFTRDTGCEPFQKVDCSSLIQDALSLCESRLRGSRILLERGPGRETVEFECRPVPLSQVLLNLLHNAADAVEGAETRWIRVTSEDLGREVQIAVEDSGPGVPLELRAKIMQPFCTTKPPHQGTGLGLAISRKIVEGHHGSLTFDSEAPHTRFVVRLPKRQSG